MERLEYKGCYFTNPDDENISHLEDEEVQKYIDEVIEALKNTPRKNSYQHTSTGDTIVLGFKYDDEIDIYVTQHYSEACLLQDEKGQWYPVNWLEEQRQCDKEEYEEMSKEQLIEEIMNLRRPEYNPRREV